MINGTLIFTHSRRFQIKAEGGAQRAGELTPCDSTSEILATLQRHAEPDADSEGSFKLSFNEDSPPEVLDAIRRMRELSRVDSESLGIHRSVGRVLGI